MQIRNSGRWRWLAGLLAAGAVGLLAAAGGQADASGEAAPGAVVEVARSFALPDGSFVTVTALVDTALADPDQAADALAPEGGRPADGGVSAAWASSSKWALEDLPVPVLYNSGNTPGGLPGADVAAWAVDAWNTFPGQVFRFATPVASGTEAGACAAETRDGQNAVQFGAPATAGVLATTCVRSRQDAALGRRIFEFDMVINTEIPWATATPTPGDAYDLPSVVLHEFGHALGLQHTEVPGSLMVRTLRRGVQVRQPGPDDAEGVRALYPQDGWVAPPSRGPLAAGFNAIAGPAAEDLAPAEFVRCLPPGSWSSLYLWSPSDGRWSHYHAGVPAYVNGAVHGGITTIPRASGLYLEMTQPVPVPRLPESAADGC